MEFFNKKQKTIGYKEYEELEKIEESNVDIRQHS